MVASLLAAQSSMWKIQWKGRTVSGRLSALLAMVYGMALEWLFICLACGLVAKKMARA